MLNSKAVVQLVYEDAEPEYTLTLYMGVRSDSGPEEPVLLENLNDLHRYFNTYDLTPSYSMAEFCLSRGYKVLLHRVNTITGVSSCRKFIDDSGESFYYSPRQGKDYSYSDRTFHPYMSPEYAVYSQIITFHEPEVIDSRATIDEDFVLLVPRQVYQLDQGFEEVTVVSALANWSWNPENSDYKELGDEYVVDPFTIRYLGQGELVYGNFKDTVLTFLENCNMSIEQIGGTDSYLISSSSNIQSFNIVSPYISGGEEVLLTSELSEIGLNDNYCYYFDDYKVATIYSKIPSAIDDTVVEITSSDGYYYVNTYRYSSDGAPLIAESFQYSTDPESSDYISNLSGDSVLVDIEVHDDTKDISGTYNLMGQERLDQDSDFLDSVKGGIEENDNYVDVCIDNDDQDDGREEYLDRLRVMFATSLIFTDYQISDMSRIVQIGPDVKWLDTGEVMKGFTYLLDLLPLDVMARTSSGIRVEESEDTYENQITSNDYGIQLIGVKARMSGVLPIKSLLSVFAMENLILSSGVTSEEGFRSLVSESQRVVNNYLSTNTKLVINYIDLQGRRLTASLNAEVDTFIVYSFKITATLLW